MLALIQLTPAVELDDQRHYANGFPLGILWGVASAVAGAPERSRANEPRSEFEPGASVHHRRLSAMYRANDLLRGDSFQVGARGRKVRVLALDQRQRDSFVQ